MVDCCVMDRIRALIYRESKETRQLFEHEVKSNLDAARRLDERLDTVNSSLEVPAVYTVYLHCYNSSVWLSIYSASPLLLLMYGLEYSVSPLL